MLYNNMSVAPQIYVSKCFEKDFLKRSFCNTMCCTANHKHGVCTCVCVHFIRFQKHNVLSKLSRWFICIRISCNEYNFTIADKIFALSSLSLSLTHSLSLTSSGLFWNSKNHFYERRSLRYVNVKTIEEAWVKNPDFLKYSTANNPITKVCG